MGQMVTETEGGSADADMYDATLKGVDGGFAGARGVGWRGFLHHLIGCLKDDGGGVSSIEMLPRRICGRLLDEH